MSVKTSSWPAPKWGEAENIQLLTTLPGFSFHVDAMPPFTKITALKEIILLAGGVAAMPGVLNGIKLLFDCSYDVFKEYGKEYIKQNDFIWLRIWEENKDWTGEAKFATPDTLKLAVNFYVDGFKRGQRRDGGNGITLPTNAAHSPLIGSVLISIARLIQLMEGVEGSFTIKMEEGTGTWHNDPYATISPQRPELSAAGKTAVVTGAGSGIGRETARAFAAAGAKHVPLLGRTGVLLNENN
ncbi:hypothetical protein Daesc_005870 [Daldinia eschscholtzii]|uniref:Uncharacterized protein n=1 Tax=Daldinia eschscholtzii TaxID=292717 RepID=A0AAX6MLQ0_9PEZI